MDTGLTIAEKYNEISKAIKRPSSNLMHNFDVSQL